MLHSLQGMDYPEEYNMLAKRRGDRGQRKQGEWKSTANQGRYGHQRHGLPTHSSSQASPFTFFKSGPKSSRRSISLGDSFTQ